MSLDSGSGSGIEKIMDPNPVNIRPDPKPCIWVASLLLRQPFLSLSDNYFSNIEHIFHVCISFKISILIIKSSFKWFSRKKNEWQYYTITYDD